MSTPPAAPCKACDEPRANNAWRCPHCGHWSGISPSTIAFVVFAIVLIYAVLYQWEQSKQNAEDEVDRFTCELEFGRNHPICR